MCFKVLLFILILLPVNSEIAVLILARGGSKGVRLKNLQKVNGVSLLSRAINTAREAGFNDITVSTDNPLIALQAIKGTYHLDKAYPFHRSAVTATDWAPSIWGTMEFLSYRPEISILILMQATSPFTRPVHLQEAVKRIDSKPYDCVFSATRSYKLRWVSKKGILYPANFKADSRVRRQDWEGEYLETGAFYITRRGLSEKGRFQNNNCTVLEVSSIESLEVDTVEDIRLANIYISAGLV